VTATGSYCPHPVIAVAGMDVGHWLWLWCQACRRDVAWVPPAGGHFAKETFCEAGEEGP